VDYEYKIIVYWARNTHVVVLQRYPVVLVLIRFFRFPLLSAYTRDPVQRVFLDPVTNGPYGPTGPVQLIQQPLPGPDHQTAAGRSVNHTTARARDAAALEAERAYST